MKLLDRALQRTIMEMAAAAYPSGVDGKEFRVVGSSKTIAVNAMYLAEHHLLKVTNYSYLDSDQDSMADVKITAKGIDFLQDDGGLSAVLEVVTIKLHEDTLKQLIAMKIEASDLPEAEKSRWLEMLKELPAEATKRLVHKLLDMGLENLPGVLQMLETLMRSG